MSHRDALQSNKIFWDRFDMHPDTRMGPVHLTVSDLKQSMSFYGGMLGLKTLHSQRGTTWLSADGSRPLLALTLLPGAKPKPLNTSGLYHFAILVPGRYDLACALHHLLDMRYPLQGASDHLVSEAIYLADPDGNGIEIYSDRPRSDWQWHEGQLHMTTEALDLDLLLAELGRGKITWEGLPPNTRIGHVHLHVGNLAAAEHFYREVLGFDLTTRYGTEAIFLSAGHYHHHLGLNTWAGRGAGPAPSDARGLRYLTICVPNETELAMLASRLQENGWNFQQRTGMLSLRDPFNNGILIVVGEATLGRNGSTNW